MCVLRVPALQELYSRIQKKKDKAKKERTGSKKTDGKRQKIREMEEGKEKWNKEGKREGIRFFQRKDRKSEGHKQGGRKKERNEEMGKENKAI